MLSVLSWKPCKNVLKRKKAASSGMQPFNIYKPVYFLVVSVSPGRGAGAGAAGALVPLLIWF